jgi:NRPS condensation-like uncharacterized protein
MPGRLNIFQRTMLQWNELHPYNAVDVVRIPGAFDSGRLQKTINGVLEINGLTGLTLNRKNGYFHYHGGPVQCEIKIIATGENPLAVEIERQINDAFITDGRFNPFRFFVAQGKNSFALGLVYFHAVADDGSVMLLLKEMVDIYLGKNPADSPAPVELYPACHDRLLRHNPGLLARKLASIPSLVSDMKNSSRPPCCDSQNMDNGFDFFSMKPETLKSLLKTAKSWGVTLNDLFLAILLKCFSPLADGREKTARRRKISIGCIVNARKDIGPDKRQAFGLFLGLFTVSHEVPDRISLKNLAKEIRRQTVEIKRKRLYLGTPLEMAFGRLLFPWLSSARKKKLFRQNFPLWGGITNMNLNSLWSQHDETKPSDYIRAVSTGPAVPFVLSVTTFNDVVNIGVSFRTSIFSTAEIRWIKTDFLKMSEQPEAA